MKLGHLLVQSSFSLQAQDNDQSAEQTEFMRMFFSYESNGLNRIGSLVMGITVQDPGAPFGFQINTAVGVGDALSYAGYIEEYAFWEVSARFGHFSDFSVYVETGLDIGELIFNYDYNRYYGHDDYHDSYYSNGIDYYIGVGGGFKLGPVGIDATMRWREISSDFWIVESQVYTGVQLSLSF